MIEGHWLPTRPPKLLRSHEMGRTTGTQITGTSGNDDITVPAGKLGTVQIDGGAGSDTLDLSNYASAGVGVSLTNARHAYSMVDANQPFHGVADDYAFYNTNTVTGTITNVENIIGTAGNDAFNVNLTVPSYLSGGAGDDFLVSQQGHATLVGGSGSDWLLAYHGNNILVGGTYDASTGVATGDGTPDYFYAEGGSTILDFEVGTDHLMYEMGSSTTFTGTWQPYGSNGSEAALFVNGSIAAVLANVSASVAATIPIQEVIVGNNGQLHGTSGDDELYAAANTTIYFDANSGNDYITHFDEATDTLVFPQGTSILWHNSMVNGEAALLGTFNGGSVTIGGLTTDSVSQLHLAGVTSEAIDVPMLGDWSVPSDSLV